MYVCVNRIEWENTPGVPGFSSFSESTFNLNDPYLPTQQSLLASYFNNQPQATPHTYMSPPYGPMESAMNTTNVNKNTMISVANTMNSGANTMSNTGNTMGYGGNTIPNGGNAMNNPANTMGYAGNTMNSVGNTISHSNSNSSNSAAMSNMPKLIYNAKAAESAPVAKIAPLEQFPITSNYQVHTYIHTYSRIHTYIHIYSRIHNTILTHLLAYIHSFIY